VQIDVVIEDARWEALDLETITEAVGDAMSQELGLDEAFEAVVMACDDDRIHALNGTFRDKDTATNVLSWPSEERGAEQDGGKPTAVIPSETGPTELGDIAIAFETCEREALDAGKPMQEHCTHLIAHGLLHLLGYDHIRDADATLMQGIEVKILGKLGLSDPYKI
jgi:probable rRNA maturation factor